MDTAWGRESSCVVLIVVQIVPSRKVVLTWNLLTAPADTKIIGHSEFYISVP